MIRCLLLQLETTLVKNGDLYPHVLEALRGLRRFETGAGAPLQLALLSFASPPGERLWDRLDELGLGEIFEERELIRTGHPITETPRRALFDDALGNLGGPRALDEVAFVTGQEDWLPTLSGYGIESFHFSRSPAAAPSFADRAFDDWGEGPLRIARRSFRDVEANERIGLEVYLSTREGMELVSVDDRLEAGSISGTVKAWTALRDGRLEELNGVLVQLPVRFRVRFAKDERVDLETAPAEAEALQEATSFVIGLRNRGSIQEDAGDMRPGCTHIVERDSAGRRRLARKRYSSI